MDLKEDSHSILLEKLNIKDDYFNATKTFVRCEMIPKDGDVFNHSMDNWKLNVDQDIVPEWFFKEEVEKRFKENYLPEVFEKCFAVNDQSWKEYKDVKLYVKNSKVKTFRSSVEARDNSSVVARGNSSVVAWDNSSVEARGNSSVMARGNSSVVARGNSSVVAWDNSSVVIPYSTGIKIKGVYDYGTIKDLSGEPKIITASNFKIVKYSK